MPRLLRLNKQRKHKDNTGQTKTTPQKHPAVPPMATRKHRSKEPYQAWTHPTTAVPIALVRSLAVYSRLCPTMPYKRLAAQQITKAQGNLQRTVFGADTSQPRVARSDTHWFAFRFNATSPRAIVLCCKTLVPGRTCHQLAAPTLP